MIKYNFKKEVNDEKSKKAEKEVKKVYLIKFCTENLNFNNSIEYILIAYISFGFRVSDQNVLRWKFANFKGAYERGEMNEVE